MNILPPIHTFDKKYSQMLPVCYIIGKNPGFKVEKIHTPVERAVETVYKAVNICNPAVQKEQPGYLYLAEQDVDAVILGAVICISENRETTLLKGPQGCCIALGYVGVDLLTADFPENGVYKLKGAALVSLVGPGFKGFQQEAIFPGFQPQGADILAVFLPKCTESIFLREKVLQQIVTELLNCQLQLLSLWLLRKEIFPVFHISLDVNVHHFREGQGVKCVKKLQVIHFPYFSFK